MNSRGVQQSIIGADKKPSVRLQHNGGALAADTGINDGQKNSAYRKILSQGG